MKALQNHIAKYIDINVDKFEELFDYFKVIHVRKKDHLEMYTGPVFQHNYFVIKGCLHMYFLTEKGDQQSVQFAIENWWINDPLSLCHQKESEFQLQAVEKSTVLAISQSDQELLLTEIPKLERYFRVMNQIGFGAALHRIKYMYEASKAARYFQFVERYPQFAQRVPQYLIASFLGLTPEYVSEIRAKNRS
ncbi:Crp/Fnr family transcriptional regulator [Euzebyella saccharophila]|uniref:Crp/Fnr family transcriptional regulator n=1 Tax=Euzebyella saccharophila TaxID=679664 RepID=A0ABV8JTV9_9FLAO|nr:Crp/Fnr family transcriptional regulator [Euzebyella saccharophila]MDO1498827.1 Crp/Fnr family transcriptional regulator [Winogradskyella maritima]